ncbi:DNA -binding domain-containing protein [Novosphingobium resinovorum]|uniref:T6SS Transcription factor RovC-like DNA binding domain-containing protein n=1 Tax=Novosphingobium resinovorum TaxID=158500 RepID=A0A1D8A2M5_9SPHN|nr:DUF2285 domain-containing protein [Novosphingobium resinovorum]AOR76391.1 hypothetical protein BES08_06225 [Novosphingobium resinovorum]
MRRPGGLTFAEDPVRDARSARILWHASLDPGILDVDVEPADPAHPESLIVARLAPWLTCVPGRVAGEHAVLSNGDHRIRLDVLSGNLSGQEAVMLSFRISGIAGAERRLVPLRQLVSLHRHGRFGRSLFPAEPRMKRWLTTLRVHDAIVSGASHQDIGIAFYGTERVASGWDTGSDSLRSRVRRLASEAARMTAGGWRRLMRGGG